LGGFDGSHTFFADEGVVSVVGIVRIARCCASAVANHPKIKFCFLSMSWPCEEYVWHLLTEKFMPKPTRMSRATRSLARGSVHGNVEHTSSGHRRARGHPPCLRRRGERFVYGPSIKIAYKIPPQSRHNGGTFLPSFPPPQFTTAGDNWHEHNNTNCCTQPSLRHVLSTAVAAILSEVLSSGIIGWQGPTMC
jgi:hypothetical protein